MGANLFFQLISRRYERGPMILTSNQSFGAWGEVFGDRIIATAILDRLLHHAVTMNIRGNSYRLKDKLKAGMVLPHDDNASQSGGWPASTILAARVASRRDVTQGMDVVSGGSSTLLLMIEGCGDVGEGGDGGQRSALSTGAAGAPQAHRPYVHSLPGAKRPASAASKLFGCPFRLRPAPQRPCADRQGPSP